MTTAAAVGRIVENSCLLVEESIDLAAGSTDEDQPEGHTALAVAESQAVALVVNCIGWILQAVERIDVVAARIGEDIGSFADQTVKDFDPYYQHYRNSD